MPMTSDDLDAVVALEQCIHAFPWTRGNFRDSLAVGHAGWLRREAGRIAAFAITMRAVDEEHLLDIGVAPECQRQGCGTQLLAFLCNAARAQGMGRMLLEVRPSNQAAIAFYRHFDFIEIGRRRGYYPAPEGREDAIVMVKDL
jgi:ribosomal-protein-alanine acetyltransferase